MRQRFDSTIRASRWISAIAISVCCVSTTPVVGQSDQEASELAASTPRVSLVRTEIAPQIDGLLDEPLWEDAALIDELTQVEPIQGAAPSQRTEVRILYDSDFIYFGIRCFDTEPQRIIAKQLQRDADQGSDDRVLLVLDPYFDHRNGYFFVVNPLGARRESLIENNSSVRDDWDGIWYAKSRIDEQGWTTEIAIPFKTISFNEATTEWGFNIQRTIRRTNEQIRWAAPVQNKNAMSVANAGVLDEIRDLDKGIGLDFKPYVKSTLRTDDIRGDGLDLDAGFDAFYKLTPSMTLALTFNTDFAETEVDERRVNLTEQQPPRGQGGALARSPGNSLAPAERRSDVADSGARYIRYRKSLHNGTRLPENHVAEQYPQPEQNDPDTDDEADGREYGINQPDGALDPQKLSPEKRFTAVLRILPSKIRVPPQFQI